MWDDLKCFVSAAQWGTFSKAAQRLGVSIATVSRRVEALEKELGLRLLDRQVTGVSLTVEGQEIYQAATVAADQFSKIERLASVLRDGVDLESVVISSTEPVISEILAPHLPQLWQAQPHIKPTLTVATDNISIALREADVAVRLARPSADNLMIKRLPAITLGLYASSAYLAGRSPSTVNLSEERLLGWDASFGDIPETQWFDRRRLQPLMASSSVRTLCHAAVAGSGIALIPDFLGRACDLVAIPAEKLPKRQPYLVFHKDFKQVKRIQAVRRWIVDCFERVLIEPAP